MSDYSYLAGVDLPRKTQARRMVQSGELVAPLINLMRARLVEGSHLRCDETTVQDFDEPGKAARSKSYMWVQVAGTGERPAMALFYYDPTRGADVPKRPCEGFSGYLRTDAYAGYNQVVRDNPITRVLCMSHARRHLVDALEAQGLNPGKLPAKTPPKARRLLTALGSFRNFYVIERRIRGRPPDNRYAVRHKEVLPVLERLQRWAQETVPKVAPQTGLGKALAYLLEHWEGLTRFLDDGRLEVDNNIAESAIRPFVIGRKRWFFSVRPLTARQRAPSSTPSSKPPRPTASNPTPAPRLHRIAQDGYRGGRRGDVALERAQGVAHPVVLIPATGFMERLRPFGRPESTQLFAGGRRACEHGRRGRRRVAEVVRRGNQAYPCLTKGAADGAPIAGRPH